MNTSSSERNNDATINDYPRYIMDKMRLLEERNNLLKEQKEQVESEKKYIENQKLKYEREVRQLKSELERLKTPPLLVGTIIDVLKDGRIVISSSTGPHFVVNESPFIRKKDILPGARVALNHQTLSVVDLLPPGSDPLLRKMEVTIPSDLSYSDIGGLDEQIRELKETVELPLTKPELFSRIGIEPPKGVLLYGSPGTGKTLLAKAVAHETNAPFIKIVGSELVQKYIGEGARLVRELFELAKEKAPSIIFIDEIDSIGSKRLEGTSGDREVQRTLMQLLAEMDGFSSRGNVKLIAATNRPDMLDDALVRPGRFDRIIEIPLPDGAARESIFRIHSRKLNISEDVDFVELSKMTEGATGADINAIVTEAGMFAIRAEKENVDVSDFQNAVKKIMKADKKQKFYVSDMFV